MRIGLVSDTHMPARLSSLPVGIFRALDGVDWLLHAGDVGELWVLDRLSAIAPVVAVHGNDDTADSQRELPYQQVVTVEGCRIFLCHSHSLVREQETAMRAYDEMGPKLDYWAGLGRSARARVVVFGHIHIPLAVERDGVLLVNPGAIASPGFETRQHRKSVAILTIEEGRPRVEHRDLAAPDAAWTPTLDVEAGFRANAARYSESILDERLAARLPELRQRLNPVVGPAGRAAYLRLAHRCWAGELDRITPELIVAEYRADPTIPDAVVADAESILGL